MNDNQDIDASRNFYNGIDSESETSFIESSSSDHSNSIHGSVRQFNQIAYPNMSTNNVSTHANEFTSLLPLYSEPVYESANLPPTYLKVFLDFIWKYLVPEVVKQYFLNHVKIEIIIIIILVVVIALILYYTGQIQYLPAYLKILLCVLSTWFDNLSFGFTCN